MGLNEFWLKFNNGKKEQLNDTKHGVRKEQVDKKFHNLFDAYDANNDGTLEENELQTIFGHLKNFAGDNVLDSAENLKAKSIFADQVNMQDVDFQGFVKSVSDATSNIISSEETKTSDGGKEIKTEYKDGTTETIAYYSNGDFKWKKIEKKFAKTTYEMILDGKRQELTEEQYNQALKKLNEKPQPKQKPKANFGIEGQNRIVFPLPTPSVEVKTTTNKWEEHTQEYSPRFIAEKLGVDINTDEGKKILERMSYLPKEGLDQIKDGAELKDVLSSNDLPPNFDNISNVLELMYGVTLRNEEEYEGSKPQREKIVQQIQTVGIMSELYAKVAEYYDTYTDNQGVFGLGSEGIGWILNKIGIQGENHYQWADSCREFIEKINDFKVLNPAKFEQEFKELTGKEKFNIDALQKMVELSKNDKAQDENGDYTDEYKQAVKEFSNFDVTNINARAWYHPENLLNGFGEVLAMIATLGWGAETKAGQMLATSTMATFGKAGVAIASKQVNNRLLQGALRLSGKGVKLIGPAINEGTKMYAYTAVTGTTSNIANRVIKFDSEDNTLDKFLDTEAMVLDSATGSFGFGAFAGAFGSTVTQKVMQRASRVSQKVGTALSDKFAKGAVDANEVFTTILEKSAPTKIAEVAAFATDVLGFTAFESVLAIVKNLDNFPEGYSVEDLTNIIWEELKNQGYNLGQIKIVAWLMSSRSARMQATRYMKDAMPQLKGATVEWVNEGKNGYKINLPDGRKIECKNATEYISALQLMVRGETAYSNKFDVRNIDTEVNFSNDISKYTNIYGLNSVKNSANNIELFFNGRKIANTKSEIKEQLTQCGCNSKYYPILRKEILKYCKTEEDIKKVSIIIGSIPSTQADDFIEFLDIPTILKNTKSLEDASIFGMLINGFSLHIGRKRIDNNQLIETKILIKNNPLLPEVFKKLIKFQNEELGEQAFGNLDFAKKIKTKTQQQIVLSALESEFNPYHPFWKYGEIKKALSFLEFVKSNEDMAIVERLSMASLTLSDINYNERGAWFELAKHKKFIPHGSLSSKYVDIPDLKCFLDKQLDLHFADNIILRYKNENNKFYRELLKAKDKYEIYQKVFNASDSHHVNDNDFNFLIACTDFNDSPILDHKKIDIAEKARDKFSYIERNNLADLIYAFSHTPDKSDKLQCRNNMLLKFLFETKCDINNACDLLLKGLYTNVDIDASTNFFQKVLKHHNSKILKENPEIIMKIIEYDSKNNAKERYDLIEELLFNENLNFPKEHIPEIIYNLSNKEILDFTKQLCFDTDINFPKEHITDIVKIINNDKLKKAKELCTNYKKLEIEPNQIKILLSDNNQLSPHQISKVNKKLGRDIVSKMSKDDLILAAQFIDIKDVNNINEMPAYAKKEFLKSLIACNEGLFNISDDMKKIFPMIPTKREEYCSLLPSIVRSLGIETNELKPEQRITMFNSSMGELSKSLAELSDTDFSKMTITQEYPKDKFILDVLDKIKALPRTERQKVYDYFGFELHHNKENETGFSITGYPVNLNNGKKLAQIEDPRTKVVVESLRPDVVRFSENNKIKCNNPKVEQFLNEVIEALPELRTTIGKKQHGNGENYGHDFDIMQHSLKVMQKVAQDPKFETLNESDQKIMLLASLMHDITKSEGRVDKTHANYGSFDSFFITQKFNLSKEEEVKLHTVIKQHEWLEYVNSAKSPEQLTKRLQSVAYDLYQGNLFDMAEIFTHADLKAVKIDDSFHDTVEGRSRIGFDGNARSFGESANAYAERIRDYIKELQKSQPLLPQTKIPRASRINEAITQVKSDGSTNIKGVYKDNDGLIVIKYNEVEDWEAIGFPKGSISHGIEIKKGEKGDAELSEDVNTGNIKFFVHGLDYSNQLAKFDAFSLVDSDALLSVSYAERPESKFRFFRPQGVLLDVNSKYIHGGGNTDAGSGCGKNIAEFKNNYIFGGHRESDRLYVSKLIKEATGMTDEQYVDFVEINKDRPIQDIEPAEIRDKIIKAFATINSNTRKGKREYNEMYISNPNEVMGVFAYSIDYNEKIANPIDFLNRSSIGKYERGYGLVKDISVKERTEFLRQYALERNLPFIIFGD